MSSADLGTVSIRLPIFNAYFITKYRTSEVFPPFAEGGRADREDVEPVEQVFPKSLLHCRIEIPVVSRG